MKNSNFYGYIKYLYENKWVVSATACSFMSAIFKAIKALEKDEKILAVSFVTALGVLKDIKSECYGIWTRDEFLKEFGRIGKKRFFKLKEKFNE